MIGQVCSTVVAFIAALGLLYILACLLVAQIYKMARKGRSRNGQDYKNHFNG